MVTKQAVKRNWQGQEEDKEGKAGPRELCDKVPVDGNAKERQVRHEQRAEALLLHQHNPDSHVMRGGAPRLTLKVSSRRQPVLDADACAQCYQAAQANQGITNN